jgi:hypothetical protein
VGEEAEEEHRQAGVEVEHHPGAEEALSQMAEAEEEVGFQQIRSSGKEGPNQEEDRQLLQGRRSQEHRIQERHSLPLQR